MSFRGGQGFYDAKVTIENVPTGKRFSMLLSITGAVALPPGRYRVVFGSMSGARGNYRTSISYLGLFGDWFEEFDVNPGEVVDLGTLRVAPYDFGSLPAEIGLEMTSVVNGGIGEAFTSYLAYNIDQSSGYLADHFMKDKFPRLTARPVRRPLQRRFDDAVFADALVRAYSRATVTQNPSHRGFEAELKQEIAAAAARNN
ncbi:MAG: hypothetical protein ACKVS5_06600 [Parvularculaceae bacterium]